MAKATTLRVQFGRRLRELRRARGMSMEALGERANVNDKYIQSIETGRQSPTLDMVEKLARGLGVPARTLFADELPAATRARVLGLIDQLDEDDLKRIAIVIQGFLAS